MRISSSMNILHVHACSQTCMILYQLKRSDMRERELYTQHSTVTKGVVIVTSGLLFEFQMNEHSEEPVCVSRGLIKKADTLTHKE